MSQIYDVTTYGATGNTKRLTDGSISSGSNSFTSASANFAAGDVGKVIYVAGAGSGGAVLSSTINSYVSNTNVLLTDNASTTVSSAVFIYGTDDSTAIWSANNAAGSVGGTVQFPTGNYLMTITLDINAPVVFQGLGMGNTVVYHGANLTGPLFYPQVDHVVFKNFTIDGGYPCNKVCNQAEIFVQGNNSVVQGVEFINFYSNGVAITGQHNKVLDSIFTGQSSATESSTFGIWFDSSNVEGTIISRNTFTGMRLNAIFGGGTLTQIVNNFFKGNHCQTSPTGGGQVAFNVSGNAYRCVIADNTFGQGGGSVTSGLEISGNDMTITGNVIEYQGLYGIILESPGTHFIVANNIVRNCGWVGGIYVGPGITDFQIIGNRCYDDQATKTQQWGVYIAAGSSDQYIVTNNNLIGNINAAGFYDGGTGINKITDDNLPVPVVETRVWEYRTLVGGTTVSSVGIAAPTANGSASNKQDAQGEWIQYSSSSVSGSVCGWTPAAFTSTRLNLCPILTMVMEMPNSTDFGTGNNVRVWCGLSSASIASQDTLNNVSGLAFRCAAGQSDTQWMICYNNGSSTEPTPIASGVIVAANTRYVFQIDCSDNANIKFLINGVKVATVSSNLPSLTQDMGLTMASTTTSNGVKHICVSTATTKQVA